MPALALRVADNGAGGGHGPARRFRCPPKRDRSTPQFSSARRRRALGVIIGHGYRPWYALLWMVGRVLAATGVVVGNPGLYVPAEPPDTGLPAAPSAVDAAGIAIDNVVPFMSTGMSAQWVLVTDRSTLWVWLAALLSLKLAGWALALLAAASVTGVIRRE